MPAPLVPAGAVAALSDPSKVCHCDAATLAAQSPSSPNCTKYKIPPYPIRIDRLHSTKACAAGMTIPGS
ncbi:hypothetical protein CGCVW01_v006641 [Colletotrichum viniferum]|nr:hypothetical protein CGCVW01_v006641 [Colletotrichum viniferum]